MKRSGMALAAVAAMVLALTSVSALASGGGGGDGSGGGGGGCGGGGGGGGGGGKVATIRYTGIVTDMEVQPEGVYVQVGTSYYNTGLVLVTEATNITVNGDSSATINDVWLGDTIQVDATSDGLAVRLEALGVR